MIFVPFGARGTRVDRRSKARVMPFSRQQIPRLPSAPISPTIGWIAANSQGTVAEAPVAVLLRRLGFSAWRKPFASCFHRPGIGNPQHPLPTTRRIISKGRHVKHLVVGQGERCLPPNHRPRRQTQRNRICRRRGALRNMMDPARTGPRCLWSPPRLRLFCLRVAAALGARLGDDNLTVRCAR